MKKTLNKIISLIRSQELEPEPPCNKESIILTEKLLKEEYDLPFPDELKELLAEQNGIFVDDFIIYSLARPNATDDEKDNDLYTINKQWLSHKYFPPSTLVLGTGDFGLIIFQPGPRQFCLMDDSTFEVLETFQTLEALLENILSMIQENQS